MSLFDIDNYTDAVSDAVSSIADAGDLIGGILKTVSPVLAMVPGLGTAFSVAIYAAGALAAKDSITDSLIGSASAGMPPGVMKIAFDGGIRITKDVANGRDPVEATVDSCRQAASAAGGAPAVKAFDSGIAMLKGGKIDQRLIDEGRAFALTSGGQAAATSFDAGVALARGQGADQVVISVARGYVKDMGGAEALAAFDIAVALGYGQTLQEAAYIGLHTLVRGNDGLEKTLNFVEQVGRARSRGLAIQELLESDLADDFLHTVSQGGKRIVDGAAIDRALQPYVEEIQKDAAILQRAAGELAQNWKVDEVLIRQAQALLRSGDGVIDQAMLENLKHPHVSLARVDGGGDSAGCKERNDAYALQGAAMAERDIELAAHRSASGTYAPALWLRGYDMGAAVAYRQTEFSAAQASIRNSLLGPTQLDAFDAARDLQYKKTIHLRQALEALKKSSISLEHALSAPVLAAAGTAAISVEKAQHAASLAGSSATTATHARARVTLPR